MREHLKNLFITAHKILREDKLLLCFTEKLYTTRAFMIIGILLYGAAFLLLVLAHFWKKNLLQKIVAPIFWSICKL